MMQAAETGVNLSECEVNCNNPDEGVAASNSMLALNMFNTLARSRRIFFLFFSGFPNLRSHRNGFEYCTSTLSCPVRPPPLTPHLPLLFYTSLSTWLSVFLSVSFLVLVHLTFYLARALLPFSWHVHLVVCLPLRHFPGAGASNILLSTRPSSLLLTCPPGCLSSSPSLSWYWCI